MRAFVRREKYRRHSVIAWARQLLHRHAFSKWLERILELLSATTNRPTPSRRAFNRSVGSVAVGVRLFTRMPCATSSIAADRVKFSNPAFPVQYAMLFGSP